MDLDVVTNPLRRLAHPTPEKAAHGTEMLKNTKT
jgi:hypothetical protein